MSRYQFVPFEIPKSRDGKYILGMDDAGILISRRKQLGYTQEEVAKKAGIQLSQYQRFESGERDIANSSMKTGLSVCAVLLLDPYEIVGIDIEQPRPEDVKPQPSFDAKIPEEVFALKPAGRKQIRRDIMKVFVNYKDTSVLIPYEVLDRIGSPSFIQMRWSIPERRILIAPATAETEESIDVPNQKFEQSLLSIPTLIVEENPISAMGWGRTAYSVETRLVADTAGEQMILIDLNKAEEADTKDINGAFMTPECFRESDDDEEDEYSE